MFFTVAINLRAPPLQCLLRSGLCQYAVARYKLHFNPIPGFGTKYRTLFLDFGYCISRNKWLRCSENCLAHFLDVTNIFPDCFYVMNVLRVLIRVCVSIPHPPRGRSDLRFSACNPAVSSFATWFRHLIAA